MGNDEAEAGRCQWIDLLDPSPDDLRAAVPVPLHPTAVELLERPASHDDEPRPFLRPEGKYVVGVLLVPVLVEQEDRIYYQEIDIVLSPEHALTVRKTPVREDGGTDPPFPHPAIAEAIGACHIGTAGMVGYHVVDEVAELFLDLVDGFHAEIDELEDNVDVWPNDKVRERLSVLRHDLLHIRRVLAPTRDAVRSVVDNRVEVDTADGTAELFPHDVELHFADAYDKLLRATEAIELARDLIGGVRDYHQSKVANDQNEVMKRLTVVASLLLVPTLIAGIYGQNFDHMPELHWHYGYLFSWGVIVATTVAQLAYFRRRHWI
jgi:magnesium transporter